MTKGFSIRNNYVIVSLQRGREEGPDPLLDLNIPACAWSERESCRWCFDMSYQDILFITTKCPSFLWPPWKIAPLLLVNVMVVWRLKRAFFFVQLFYFLFCRETTSDKRLICLVQFFSKTLLHYISTPCVLPYRHQHSHLCTFIHSNHDHMIRSWFILSVCKIMWYFHDCGFYEMVKFYSMDHLIYIEHEILEHFVWKYVASAYIHVAIY